MSAANIDGDFTVVGTAMLNRCFRGYFRQHGQGGTNAQERNLRNLFNSCGSYSRMPSPAGGRLVIRSPLSGSRCHAPGPVTS